MSGGEDLTQVNVSELTRAVYYFDRDRFVPFDSYNESSCFAATLSNLEFI